MDITNLHEFFKSGEIYRTVPFIEIPKRDTDHFEIYYPGKSRLDKISRDYYKYPYFSMVILQANPEYTLEMNIQEEVLLRIPYPLSDVLEDYRSAAYNQQGL